MTTGYQSARFYSAESGPAGAPVVVLLHGFTGSSASWREIQDSLSRDCHTMAVDLPGHGRTQVRPPDFEACIAALEAWADSRAIHDAHLYGYSMGGRVALAWALRNPKRWRELTLESASPGIENTDGQTIRAASDNQLAEKILADGVVPFVDQWEAQPLFATQAGLSLASRQSIRSVRLSQTPEGLAWSLRVMGTGRQPGYWERLGELKMPVRLIAGELDEKYLDIARRMAAKIPRVELETVPGAGHAVHAERPGLVSSLILKNTRSNDVTRRHLHADPDRTPYSVR